MPETEHKIEITPLGAGQEVGRSCILLKFNNKRVLLDCGIHPGYTGIKSLPFLDLVDLSTIDLLLVSHFHLDHIGCLPYLTSKTSFSAPIFMTQPTKSIYQKLLSDFLLVSQEALFTRKDLEKSMEKIETIHYHERKTVSGINFWCYRAGHVLGAVQFMIEFPGSDVRVLYTGDYSRLEDRHLSSAEIPEESPLVCICESTYGLQCHPPIAHRERNFTDNVTRILSRGGKCLLPCFSLGRSQELLLLLDEFWENYPQMREHKIYFVSNLAKKSLQVYRTYTNMMNERFQLKSTVSNPFNLKHIKILESSAEFYKEVQGQPQNASYVVLASPGMLQSGFSRELFEKWAEDKRNGLVLTGYSVNGTLAKTVVSEPEKVKSISGAELALRMGVYVCNFSAHVDFAETTEFLEKVDPRFVVLVHGEHNEMARLKNALEKKASLASSSFFMPRNAQSVEINILRPNEVTIAEEELAGVGIAGGKGLEGVVIDNKFFRKENIVKHFTAFCVKQRVFVPADLGVVLRLADRVYNRKTMKRENDRIHEVAGCVGVYESQGKTFLEWVDGIKSNTVAETIFMMVVDFFESGNKDELAKEVRTQKEIVSERNRSLVSVLNEGFESVVHDDGENKIVVRDDCGNEYVVHLGTMRVEGEETENKRIINEMIGMTDGICMLIG